MIFEKENINTLDSKGEVLLSILSSLAQDESRSISENSTWGIRRRFEQGKTVRRIYKEFLDGKSTKEIARVLEYEGIPNWDGKAKWYDGSIQKMLGNEKYKGEALLQKTYTVDFLSKKRAENIGQVPQYYVEESHPAIIDKDVWEAVQLEMERRHTYAAEHGLGYGTNDNPFAGRVICGTCGNLFGRKVWNSTNEKQRRIIWRCGAKYKVKGIKGCESKHINDRVLYQVFIKNM